MELFASDNTRRMFRRYKINVKYASHWNHIRDSQV